MEPTTYQEFIGKLDRLLCMQDEWGWIPLTLVEHYMETHEYSVAAAILEARATRTQLLLLNPQ